MSYAESHKIIIKSITFLTFNYFNEIYIKNLSQKIKISELEALSEIKRETISDDSWNRIVDLDFHINQYGNFYTVDIVRLAEAMVYNMKNLYGKIKEGNNIKTYLSFATQNELEPQTEKDLLFKMGSSQEKKSKYQACKMTYIRVYRIK